MTIDKIVVLDPLSTQTEVPRFRYVLRLTVPQFAQPQYQSSVNTSQFPNADAETIAALRLGRITEVVKEYTAAAGVTWLHLRTNTPQRQQVQADLVAVLNTEQATLDGNRPWSLYGAGYDGTAWHL